MQLGKLSQLTLEQMMSLWNEGFRYFHKPMEMTMSRMAQKLASLDPELSVVGWVDGIPVGFVWISVVHSGGRARAWNAGTGMHADYRGRGLSKLLLMEAVERVRKYGANTFALETNTRPDNTIAIRAYERCGFRIVEQLKQLRQPDDTTAFPPYSRSASYRCMRGPSSALEQLPFYGRFPQSWTTEWFTNPHANSIVVMDARGLAAGYALFQESDSRITLLQCELAASHSGESCKDMVRYMLNQVFRPWENGWQRQVKYLRSNNKVVLEQLATAGFMEFEEEHLMTITLQGE